MITLPKPAVFVWDKGNSGKNLKKHGVGDQEAEEAFGDKRKVISRDVLHSRLEERFILLGQSKKKKLLYIVFTFRGGNVRIISARCINKKEATLYEKKA